jgi:hypothetical protein
MSDGLVPKDVRRVLGEVVPRPRHRANLDVVAGLIEELQAVDGPESGRALQKKLFEEVASAEQEQREAQRRKEGVDRELKAVMRSGPVARTARQLTVRELQKQSESRGLDVEVLRRVRRQLRTVGDGLLWRAVGFNRAYAFAVSDAPGRGNLSLSDSGGLEAELDAVERFWRDERSLAVMHDLTNVGRIGDLTVVPPSGTIKVAEVKASGSLDPRQLERMRGMVKFLRGAGKPLEDGSMLRMETAATPVSGEPLRWEFDHWDDYAAAIDEAGRRGIGSGVVEDYLGIVAVVPGHPSWEVVRTAPVSEEQRERVYGRVWDPVMQSFKDALVGGEGDVVGTWDAAEKNEGGAFGAPFSVYPLPAERCAALVCDYLKLYTFANHTRFQGRFRDKGFNVLVATLPSGKRGQHRTPEVFLSRPKWMADGTRRMIRVHLGRPLMQQVVGEAMSFETVARAVREHARGKVRGEGASTLLFLNGDGSRFVADTPPEAARAFDEMARQRGV